MNPIGCIEKIALWKGVNNFREYSISRETFLHSGLLIQNSRYILPYALPLRASRGGVEGMSLLSAWHKGSSTEKG